jgi:hypothetical protein
MDWCQNNLSFFPTLLNLQFKSDKEGLNMMKKNYWVATVLLVLQTLIATPDAEASARATKKIGIGFGLVTEPFPSLIGFTGSFNLANFLRLTAGYGSVSDDSLGLSVTTVAIDAKIFPVDWNFAPFFDIGFVNVSGSVGSGSSSVKAAGSALDYGFGVDWQTYLGFNLGIEYKMMSQGGTSVGLPGFYLGWFF